MSSRQHVVPRGTEWAVRRENSSRDTSHHQTQEQAIRAGREISKNQRSELVIHRPDGRIRDSDSFGNDPCPPKDTKH
jgi:hypothetical protein